jgi:hypothetical protein
MTNRTSRSPTRRTPRVRAAVVLAVLSLVAMMAVAPGVMAGGTVVVTAFPGGGWIKSLDNTAGGSVQLVPGPGPGTLGTGSIQLTTAANSDFAGVAHPFLATGLPYSELAGASWRTFVTGATGTPGPEAASLRLSGYQDGTIPFSDFTTLAVERIYNGGVTPNVWEDSVLSDTTMVWQTTDSGDGFCLNVAPSPLCTFADFKLQYPDGRFTALQVAIGTGVPAVTSYADGVSVTTLVNGTPVTESWDFEPAAAPAASAAASIPSTGMAAPSAQPGSTLAIALGSLALLSVFAIAIVQRRRLSR